jgi:dGTPase
LSPYIDGGYDHAVWGSDVVLVSLNLCTQTLDGIRNHSWSRPAPSTPEGEVVSWADRIAYVCHDFEDAVAAGVVTPQQLPDLVRTRCGVSRAQQLRTFIHSMIQASAATGRIGMVPDIADALAAFRQFNYDQVYLRAESQAQAQAVIDLLRSLVDHFASHPRDLPLVSDFAPADPGSTLAVRNAVTYVGGMTDRFACRQAITLLQYDISKLPQGIDTSI